MQRRAFDQANGCERRADHGAVRAHGVDGVMRAGRCKAAPTSGAENRRKERRNRPLINSQESDQDAGRKVDEDHEEIHGSDFLSGHELTAGLHKLLFQLGERPSRNGVSRGEQHVETGRDDLLVAAKNFPQPAFGTSAQDRVTHSRG